MRNILSTSGHVHALLQKVQTHQKLQYVFHALLPSPLKEHCKVANYREGVLVIETDSPAWKMQLVYSEPEILKQLQREKMFHGLRALKFYVRPEVSPPPSPKKPVLSSVGQTQLSELVSILKVSDTMTGDSKPWPVPTSQQKEKS